MPLVKQEIILFSQLEPFCNCLLHVKRELHSNEEKMMETAPTRASENLLIFGKYGWQPGLTTLSTKMKSLLSWKTYFKVTNKEQEECEKGKGESTSTITSDLQFQANTQEDITCHQLLHTQHVLIWSSYQLNRLQGSSACWDFQSTFLVLGIIRAATKGDLLLWKVGK